MTEISSTLKLSETLATHPINVELPSQTLMVDRSEVGPNDASRLKHNLLGLARSYPHVRELVSHLANNGFYLVAHKDGVSRFEHLSDPARFLQFFDDSSVQLRKELFYTLEKPSLTTDTPRLLVVFSSIADFPLNASISRRMFFRNFPTIGKYIPSDTHILRIADVGSVLGSFYLNNNHDPGFADKIQDLIRFVVESLGIDKSNVVLYGASKGATATLYHGIVGGYSGIAVDPIVSDEYYLKKMNDAHFVEGKFPTYKEAVFSELLQAHPITRPIHVVTSPSSEQYQHIDTLLKERLPAENLMLYEFCNPRITTHTEVGPNTINFVTAMLNNLFYGIHSTQSQRYTC